MQTLKQRYRMVLGALNNLISAASGIMLPSSHPKYTDGEHARDVIKESYAVYVSVGALGEAEQATSPNNQLIAAHAILVSIAEITGAQPLMFLGGTDLSVMIRLVFEVTVDAGKDTPSVFAYDRELHLSEFDHPSNYPTLIKEICTDAVVALRVYTKNEKAIYDRERAMSQAPLNTKPC